MPVSQLNGIQIDAPSLAENLPLRNTKDYEDYISRMKQFPKIIDQTWELLQMGLDRKVTPPKITLRDVAEQIKAQITESAEKSPFFKPFLQFVSGISQADQQRLKTEAKQVVETQIVPAYKKLYDVWTQKYYPNTRDTIAISSFPDG